MQNWLFALVPAAWGHASAFLEGIDLHTTRSGAHVVEASFGLLWADAADAEYRWLCHEAVTQTDALISPRYAFGADDAILAAVPALDQARELAVPVYRSTDQCAWTPALGLDGVPVVDVAMHPTDPAIAIAISANEAAGTGKIFRSTDGGASFDAAHEATDWTFRSVRFGPDGAIWVAASSVAPVDGAVLHSADGGETWTALPVPMPEGEDDVDTDVLLGEAGSALLAVGPFFHDRLLRIQADGTVTTLAEPDVEINDVAEADDGTIWMTGDGNTLLRVDADGVSVVETAPLGQGLDWADGVMSMAIRSQLDGRQVLESTDGGVTWQTALHLSDLQPPPACPASSDTATRCSPIWDALSDRLPLAPGETPDDEDDEDPGYRVDTGGDGLDAGSEKDGGCGGGGAAAVLLLPLLFALRRKD